mgnify:CR=1 FL=1
MPSRFASPVARDQFFDREQARLRDLYAARRRELVSDCKVACQGAIGAVDKAVERDLAELERLRASAKIGAAD